MAVKKKAPKSRRYKQPPQPKKPSRIKYNKPNIPTRVRLIDAVANNSDFPKKALFKRFPEIPITTYYKIIKEDYIRSKQNVNSNIPLGRLPAITKEYEEALAQKVFYKNFKENLVSLY